MTDIDEPRLVQIFAQAASEMMTLRELAEAWDRICLPVWPHLSLDTRELLRAAYDTNRRVLSGA